jgi:hypothetical protein
MAAGKRKLVRFYFGDSEWGRFEYDAATKPQILSRLNLADKCIAFCLWWRSLILRNANTQY